MFGRGIGLQTRETAVIEGRRRIHRTDSMWPMLTLRGCGGEGSVARDERKESSEEASLRSVLRHEAVMEVDKGRWLIVLMTDSHLFFSFFLSHL